VVVVFGHRWGKFDMRNPGEGDVSVSTAAGVPFWAWLVFVGLVLALHFLDLFVLHRKAREAHMAHRW
jgi:hypothetical protein